MAEEEILTQNNVVFAQSLTVNGVILWNGLKQLTENI